MDITIVDGRPQKRVFSNYLLSHTLSKSKALVHKFNSKPTRNFVPTKNFHSVDFTTSRWYTPVRRLGRLVDSRPFSRIPANCVLSDASPSLGLEAWFVTERAGAENKPPVPGIKIRSPCSATPCGSTYFFSNYIFITFQLFKNVKAPWLGSGS